jgi:hypothetical protein
VSAWQRHTRAAILAARLAFLATLFAAMCIAVDYLLRPVLTYGFVGVPLCTFVLGFIVSKAYETHAVRFIKTGHFTERGQD